MHSPTPMSYMPQSGLNKTRSPYLAVQFENVINSTFPSPAKMVSTFPDTTTPLTNSIFALRPSTMPSACNWSFVSNSGDADVCFHFPMGNQTHPCDNQHRGLRVPYRGTPA